MAYRFIATLLILLALVLNLPQVVNSPPVKSLRSVSASVFYPAQISLHALLTSHQNIVRFLSRTYRVDLENEKLREKLDRALAEKMALNYLAKENEALRESFSFINRNPYRRPLIPAEIISRGGSNLDEEIIVNKGTRQGVEEGMTVIAREGLVGRVVEVTPFTSKVRMIISPGNSISAVLKEAGAVGVARGGFGRKLKLENIPEETEIGTRETVVVSASSGEYVRGITIGEVASVKKSVNALFCDIEVEPLVDFSRLKVVYLCKP